MPFQIGPTELIIILLILMMVFGVGKLPQVGAAIGRGIKEFRTAQSEIDKVAKPTNSTPQAQKGERES